MGTVPSTSHPLTVQIKERGAGDLAVHRDNNKLMPKEFASVTKQCLSWVTLRMRWQKLWGTGGKGAHCMGWDGRGHRQLLPLPIVPACCTKPPGEEPGRGAGDHGAGGHGAGGHGNTWHCCQKPSASLGPAWWVAGVTGGWQQEWRPQGLPRVPG